MKKTGIFGEMFDHFSKTITYITGRPITFIIALSVVIVWAISGPIFNFSDTRQLIINTGTTVITFLMVFVIQQSQNKETVALHLKLNELIAATNGASNRLINIEDLTEDQLIALKRFYIKLADLSQKEKDVLVSHSIEEAVIKHKLKINNHTK